MTGWFGYLASAAFLAGIAGGVHCAAMCGPIVAACAGSRGVSASWRGAATYNFGRILSYVLAGALAGAFGSASFALRGDTSAQSMMAALAGSALLVLALHLAGFASVTRTLEAGGAVLWRRLQPYSRRVLPADTLPRVLALGALWGWLPCGMVYAALVTAVATADPAEGALVMLAFGAGTVPNMFALAMAAKRLQRVLRIQVYRRTVAAVIAAFGVLGLSFAIQAHPYTLGQMICRVVPAASSLMQ